MRSAPSGDARFRDVFTAHRDDVWCYCARRLPREEAQDAVADVFVVVWRRLDQVPAGDEARPWIYGIARNVVRNRQRSGRRRLRLASRLASLGAPTAPSADDGASRREEQGDLLAAVDDLRPDDRELLRLRTWEELSLAEIATVTGMSTRAVESRLSRLRKKLARTLDAGTNASRPAGTPSPDPRPMNEQMWLSPTRHEGGER